MTLTKIPLLVAVICIAIPLIAVIWQAIELIIRQSGKSTLTEIDKILELKERLITLDKPSLNKIELEDNQKSSILTIEDQIASILEQPTAKKRIAELVLFPASSYWAISALLITWLIIGFLKFNQKKLFTYSPQAQAIYQLVEKETALPKEVVSSLNSLAQSIESDLSRSEIIEALSKVERQIIDSSKVIADSGPNTLGVKPTLTPTALAAATETTIPIPTATAIASPTATQKPESSSEKKSEDQSQKENHSENPQEKEKSDQKDSPGEGEGQSGEGQDSDSKKGQQSEEGKGEGDSSGKEGKSGVSKSEENKSSDKKDDSNSESKEEAESGKAGDKQGGKSKAEAGEDGKSDQQKSLEAAKKLVDQIKKESKEGSEPNSQAQDKKNSEQQDPKQKTEDAKSESKKGREDNNQENKGSKRDSLNSGKASEGENPPKDISQKHAEKPEAKKGKEGGSFSDTAGFKELEVKSNDEALNPEFAKGTNQTELNSNTSQSKIKPSQIEMAKPKISKEREQQQIPLAYLELIK